MLEEVSAIRVRLTVSGSPMSLVLSNRTQGPCTTSSPTMVGHHVTVTVCIIIIQLIYQTYWAIYSMFRPSQGISGWKSGVMGVLGEWVWYPNVVVPVMGVCTRSDRCVMVSGAWYHIKSHTRVTFCRWFVGTLSWMRDLQLNERLAIFCESGLQFLLEKKWVWNSNDT